jgi:hypothetical protein
LLPNRYSAAPNAARLPGRPDRSSKQAAFLELQTSLTDQAFFLGRAISVRSAFGAEETEPAQIRVEAVRRLKTSVK